MVPFADEGSPEGEDSIKEDINAFLSCGKIKFSILSYRLLDDIARYDRGKPELKCQQSGQAFIQENQAENRRDSDYDWTVVLGKPGGD